MKKRLLTLGALGLTVSISAQILTTVGDKAQVYVKKDALVYNGGGMKTVASGKIDNSGNIMVVGDAKSKFATLNASAANKGDGGNIILRMTEDNVGQGLRYGQLYIKGLVQDNITAVVDKQYKDVAHGTYQQIALPFYDKALSSLNKELEKTFTDERWTQNEILVWNNRYARFDQLMLAQTTKNATRTGEAFRNANTTYYAIGSKGFDASAGVKTVKGVPYADNISENLFDAAKGLNFGADGSAQNYYREKYNSYLQDYFDYSNDGSGAWKNNYGRNLYQFGNPFLTNIDLGHLKNDFGDELQGVRVEATGVESTARGATYSTSAKYITYTASAPTGDVDLAIIKPMQTFVVKLKSSNAKTLNFDNLRRFAYTRRDTSIPYSVNALSKEEVGEELSAKSKFFSASKSTVKQLGVIALDATGKEIGRTYYVVYADAVSGQPINVSTQVIGGDTAIGTFEEAKEGGIDKNLQNSYWLYINEANEKDFKGKEIPLRIYNTEVKSLKFEIREDAKLIADGQEKLSSGESFYINTGGDNFVKLGNAKSINLATTDGAFGLYYGKPTSMIVDDVKVEKPSSTFVAYDNSVEAYKVIFDSTWKTAFVQVFDMAGRLIVSQNNVDTTQHYTINLPVKGTYVVTAISESGKKFSQKIVK